MSVVFILFAICWAPLNFIGLAVASAWYPGSQMAVCGQLLHGVSQQLSQYNYIRTSEPKFQEGIQKNYSLTVYSQGVLCGSSNDVACRVKCRPSLLMTTHNLIKVDSV